MPTTLKLPSFAENNIRERTSLKAAVAAGVSVLPVESTQGLVAGQTIYIGALAREECEKAVIQAVSSPTSLTLTAPTSYEHAAFDAVTGVLGDMIHLYRAANVDGSVPADAGFSVLATRNIDPDQVSSYYTDSTGSAGFWYRWTYYNVTTLEETPLIESPTVRGDDFGHYASLEAIRKKAGFENATRLSDLTIDQQRRIAESQINARLGGYMTVPFTKPIPDIIETITILLAAGYLKNDAYGSANAGKSLIDEAEAGLQSLIDGSASTGDPTYDLAAGVSGWPIDPEPRMFSVEDEY